MPDISFDVSLNKRDRMFMHAHCGLFQFDAPPGCRSGMVNG
jgi:hypothetical protein